MIVDELVTMDFETFSQQDLDPDPEVEDWDGEYGISRLYCPGPLKCPRSEE